MMANDKIIPIPKLPEQIIDAVNRDTLAIFIGAGVSRIIGCASWEKLANDLIESVFFKFVYKFQRKKRPYTHMILKSQLQFANSY